MSFCNSAISESTLTHLLGDVPICFEKNVFFFDKCKCIHKKFTNHWPCPTKNLSSPQILTTILIHSQYKFLGKSFNFRPNSEEGLGFSK